MLYNTMTEEQLIVLIADHNPDAYNELMQRTRRICMGICKKYDISFEDSEDITQEVFIRVYKSAKGFDRTKKFRPWFYMICHNEIKRSLSNQHKRYNMVDPEGEYGDISYEMDVDDMLVSEKIINSIANLPDHIREVYIMVVVDGYTPLVCAEKLGITPSSVHYRIKTAKQHIRCAINGKEESPIYDQAVFKKTARFSAPESHP